MKFFRSPDFIAGVAIAAILVLAACSLGWPLKGSGGWRVFLLAIIPIIHAGFSICWITNPRIRLPAYRLYYLAFGPRCDVQVLGTVPVDCSWDDATALGAALSVAQNWRKDAKQTLRISNRSVIQAGPRTLSVNIVGDWAEYDANAEATGFPSNDRHISIDLRGYESRLTRMDSLLQREVQALLDALSKDEIKRVGKRPNFTLRVHIEGTNPFLAFYLRDVPIPRIDNFQLQIDTSEFGNDVNITVTSNMMTVAAHSPSALVGSARRYLATPAIAHLN